jgi:hypothetical protein
MESLKVNGKDVEVIEIFDLFVLIQEIKSGEIYLVHHKQFDDHNNSEYNEPISNVVSLEEYRKWQKTKIGKKPKLKQCSLL